VPFPAPGGPSGCRDAGRDTVLRRDICHPVRVPMQSTSPEDTMWVPLWVIILGVAVLVWVFKH